MKHPAVYVSAWIFCWMGILAAIGAMVTQGKPVYGVVAAAIAVIPAYPIGRGFIWLIEKIYEKTGGQGK